MMIKKWAGEFKVKIAWRKMLRKFFMDIEFAACPHDVAAIYCHTIKVDSEVDHAR